MKQRSLLAVCLLMALNLQAFEGYSSKVSSEGWEFRTPHREGGELIKNAAHRAHYGWLNYLKSLSLAPASGYNRIPILWTLGLQNDSASFTGKKVELQKKEGHQLILGTWNYLPITSDQFESGMIQTLVLRTALEQIPKGQVGLDAWNVPPWIPAGLSLLVAGNSMDGLFQHRAVLMARMETALTLDELVYELENTPCLNEAQETLSAILCKALTQNPEVRQRFLLSMARQKAEKPRLWFSRILQVKEDKLDEWWTTVWEREALLFSVYHLGYEFSAQSLVEFEKSLQNSEDPARMLPAFESRLNPWFGRWRESQKGVLENKERWNRSIQYRKDVELRRTRALSWFLSKQDGEPVWELPGRQSFLLAVPPEGKVGRLRKWMDAFEP